MIAKNGGSDRYENFFAFAEHVPSRAEPPYEAVKISDFEKKIRKHENWNWTLGSIGVQVIARCDSREFITRWL